MSEPSGPTAMAAVKPPHGKRAAVADWIERHRPARIGEAERAALVEELGDVSPGYLRRLLRACGVPLTPMVEGVRQEDFPELERSLLGLLAEYQHGDRTRRQEVRRLVIEARDHAALAARSARGAASGIDKRAVKQEMILWMRTWLENPPLFPDWVKLRCAALVKTQELDQEGS